MLPSPLTCLAIRLARTLPMSVFAAVVWPTYSMRTASCRSLNVPWLLVALDSALPSPLVRFQVRNCVSQLTMPVWSAGIQPGAPESRIARASTTWVIASDDSMMPSLRPTVVHGTTWANVMFGFIFVAALRNQVRTSSSARAAYAALPV